MTTLYCLFENVIHYDNIALFENVIHYDNVVLSI
jgi:hypothetical protein